MRLNIATRHLHAAADEPWLELLRSDVTRARYLSTLVQAYGLVAPFESACMYTPGLNQTIDFRRLTRAGFIAQDLLALRLAPIQVANIRQCHSITPFRNATEAMGWLYVFERGTLLHAGVRKHLLAYLPEVDNALAYLTTFEGRVGEHWNTFGRILDGVATTPQIADEVVNAALSAFACVNRWLRRNDERRQAV